MSMFIALIYMSVLMEAGNSVESESYCYSCDSQTDPNCGFNPKAEMATKCSRPNEGCYLIRINSNIYKRSGPVRALFGMYGNYKRTRRGCLSELGDEDLKRCQSGGDEYCKICKGDNCNRKIKPQTCIRCSSETDENCLNKPSAAQSMECEHYDDKCITIIHANETLVRDCRKESQIDEIFCDQNPWHCTTCENDDCNTIFTIQKTCYRCNSIDDKDCATDVDATWLANCPFSAKNPGCYHYIGNYSVSRGCVADLDGDIIEDCKQGSNQCKICQQDSCNANDSFPTCRSGKHVFNEPLSSYETKICNDYNDKCFIHVENDTIIRGCLQEYITENELSLDFLKNRTGKVMYRTCSTPMCNDDEILREICINCDSDVDPNCRSNVTTSMRRKCSFAQELMGCYHYEDMVNDLVIRGCVSELDEKEPKMLHDKLNSLKFCKEFECNSEPTFLRCMAENMTGDFVEKVDVKCYTHVKERKGCLKETDDLIITGIEIEEDCKNLCIVCDSEIDGEGCWNAPDTMSLETCNNSNSECYTHIRNNTKIVRGCIEEFEHLNDLMHDKCTGFTCERCNGTIGCNNKIIKNQTCYECDSTIDAECRENPTHTVKCPLTIEPIGCYHFQELNSTRRGCMSSLTESKMREFQKNDDKHKTCLQNDCNSKKQFEECWTCDSRNDPHCIDSPVDSKYCHLYDSQCYTFIGRDFVTRGCLQDTQPELVQLCKSFPNKCEICSIPNCNRQNLTIEQCVMCDANEDQNCTHNPKNSQKVFCGSVLSRRREGCYMGTFSGRVRRGCVQDLTFQHKYHVCLDSKNEACKICLGDNCNEKPNFSVCFSCNSRYDDDCTEVTNLTQSVICPNYDDHCTTEIHQSKYTVRKCVPRSEDKKFNDRQKICYEDNCNTHLLPFNRLRCYQCNGEPECKFNGSISVNANVKLRACDIYSKYDKCYTYMDYKRETYRGCLSDGTDSRILCEENPDLCDICAENGCNNQPVADPPTLTCTKCKDADDCVNGRVNATESACESPVWFGTKESCFTYVHRNGTVERGCTLDIAANNSDWCKLNKNCEQCFEPNCNKKDLVLHSCHQCDSDMDNECWQLPYDNDFTMICDVSDHLTETGCYTRNQNGAISRGCVKDMSIKEYEICEEVEWCKICYGNDCNDEKFDSSAQGLIASGFLMAFSFIIASFQ